MKKSVVFLHIPKTAGTSINEAFRPLFDEASFYDHCESRGAGIVSSLAATKTPFFASGHLRFPALVPLVRRPDIFHFTCVRRPQEQLRSHLNWVMAYGAPEAAAKRKTIDPNIADFAKQLWQTDLNDVDAMSVLMKKPIASGLFDNPQTRYLRVINHQKPVTRECVASAQGVFYALDMVFTLNDYEEALSLLGEKYPRLGEAGRKNVGQMRKKINFNDEKVAAFYKPFIQFDIQLVNAYRWKSRQMFFPHLLK